MKNLIVVTGGLGFIGSNLIELLIKKKFNVLNIDNKSYSSNTYNTKPYYKYLNYAFQECDLNNQTKLNKIIFQYKPICIFNLAAETHVDRSIDSPKSFIKSNILGVFNLLEVFKKYSKKNKQTRLIHISTDEVFGDMLRGRSNETFSYKPSSPYAASKAASDHLVYSYVKTYKIPAVITNCSNNFGPKQHPEKLIPKLIYNILNNRNLPIYGNGKNSREWIYVDDHCDALIKVFKKGKIGEFYNIGSNKNLNNLEIYNFTKEETGPHKTSNVYQIYDFNGSFWSHYDPYDSISSNVGFTTSMSYDGLFIINSGRTNDKGHVHGGKDQFGYEAVEFLKLGRTIKVVGNTTIGGDISARDFVVGGGKYTTYPKYSGQVIFSDTPGTDTGSNALIRNWNYKNDNVTSSTFNNQNNYTSSELLIHKGGEYPDKLKAWGREPDRIRVQGRSIVLDTTYSDDVNPSNIHPKFVLDTFGKIGVNLPELQPESLTFRDGFGPYKENIKARLDVNGRTAIRNKLDIDYGNKSNVTIGKQTLVHYDTRDINCLKGIYLQDSGPREVYRSNLTSVSCNYKSSERGIHINEGGNIKGVINTDIGNNTAVSFWFMMENEHSTYNNKTLFYIGNTNTNVQEQIIACEIYYTSSLDHGIRLHFINENDKKLEFKYTLVSKKWHHIYFEREGTLQINNL